MSLQVSFISRLVLRDVLSERIRLPLCKFDSLCFRGKVSSSQLAWSCRRALRSLPQLHFTSPRGAELPKRWQRLLWRCQPSTFPQHCMQLIIQVRIQSNVASECNVIGKTSGQLCDIPPRARLLLLIRSNLPLRCLQVEESISSHLMQFGARARKSRA